MTYMVLTEESKGVPSIKMAPETHDDLESPRHQGAMAADAHDESPRHKGPDTRLPTASIIDSIEENQVCQPRHQLCLPSISKTDMICATPSRD